MAEIPAHLAPDDNLHVFSFPSNNPGQDPQQGLTIREWYAGMALQGLMANPQANLFPGQSRSHPGRGLALMCFACADALIEYEKAEYAGESPPLAGSSRQAGAQGQMPAPATVTEEQVALMVAAENIS